jgi:hypothetical protein
MLYLAQSANNQDDFYTFCDELKKNRLVENLKDEKKDNNSNKITIFQHPDKQTRDSCICLASVIKLANSQRNIKTG